MLLQQLAEAQVRFFLLMIKKSFLAIFMRVKDGKLLSASGENTKKGPLRAPVIACGSVDWDENR